MAIVLEDPPGATPIDPDELAGLIPRGVTTVGELNAYEAENILDALRWLERQRRAQILNEGFVRALHKRMFGHTWRWAGTFRNTEKNIGVPPEAIAVRLRALLLDCIAQLEDASMALDDIAARFHHRLVWIHAFTNGNGRHARLMADVLLQQQGAAPFSWGAGELGAAGPVRQQYIEALQAADKRNYAPLFLFVRA